MRFPWQCPTCFAQLDDKHLAKVVVCPYCGSLLVVDSEKKKFYLAKHENGWYYFTKVPLGERTGYLRFADHEIFFILDGEKWLICYDGKIGEMIEEVPPESENCEGVRKDGEVQHIWGDLPILALPGMIIEMCENHDKIVLKSSRGAYIFNIL